MCSILLCVQAHHLHCIKQPIVRFIEGFIPGIWLEVSKFKKSPANPDDIILLILGQEEILDYY